MWGPPIVGSVLLKVHIFFTFGKHDAKNSVGQKKHQRKQVFVRVGFEQVSTTRSCRELSPGTRSNSPTKAQQSKYAQTSFNTMNYKWVKQGNWCSNANVIFQPEDILEKYMCILLHKISTCALHLRLQRQITHISIQCQCSLMLCIHNV